MTFEQLPIPDGAPCFVINRHTALAMVETEVWTKEDVQKAETSRTGQIKGGWYLSKRLSAGASESK